MGLPTQPRHPTPDLGQRFAPFSPTSDTSHGLFWGQAEGLLGVLLGPIVAQLDGVVAKGATPVEVRPAHPPSDTS